MPKCTDIQKILILGSGPIGAAPDQQALKGRAFKARRKTPQKIRGFGR